MDGWCTGPEGGVDGALCQVRGDRQSDTCSFVGQNFWVEARSIGGIVSTLGVYTTASYTAPRPCSFTDASGLLQDSALVVRPGFGGWAVHESTRRSWLQFANGHTHSAQTQLCVSACCRFGLECALLNALASALGYPSLSALLTTTTLTPPPALPSAATPPPQLQPASSPSDSPSPAGALGANAVGVNALLDNCPSQGVDSVVAAGLALVHEHGYACLKVKVARR